MSRQDGSLSEQARVVVIGGGAVGCSVAWHLALLGWRDVVLLERNELASGSTWHAAGNCPNYAASWTILQMQSYSTALYRRLAGEADSPINYHVTGALRLAHNRQRMEEFRHVQSMGRALGVAFEEVGADEMRRLYPFLETHDLYGGQWDPTDGDIDPSQLTQALAKAARKEGVSIVRFCPVTGVSREGGEWRVDTPKGAVRCEFVVNAAGYYAGRVGEFFGRRLPMAVMEHQYLVTETVPELAEREGKLPLLRDPDVSYYLRQEKDGLLLGPYERHCRTHWSGGDERLPEDFSFQLFADDLERLDYYIDDACRRVPLLGQVGIKRVINGPIPYAPDGLPLVGPMPGVRNAFEACVFTFGVVQAGGAGKLLAELMVYGESEGDAWAVDPRRFTDFADTAYAKAKAVETYGHEYAMHFPHVQWAGGRPGKKTPLYDVLVAAGAEMGAYGGWERADWFCADDALRRPVDSYDQPHWFAAVGEECRHVAEHVGVIDLTGFSRFHLSGEGAAEWLDGMVAGRVPAEGRIGLLYLLTPRGRVLSEMTATRFSDGGFWLVSAAAARWHDRDWLHGYLPERGGVRLSDVSDDFGVLLVSGPTAHGLIVDCLGEAVAELSPMCHRTVDFEGTPLTVIRVSFTGEFGYELHIAREKMPALFAAVWRSGERFQLKHFGMLALDSMRLEKGYRSWKGDLISDYSPLECGLERWVKLEKPHFVGRDALLAAGAPGRCFVMLALDAPEDGLPAGDAVYLSPVLAAGEAAGLVLAGGYGHRMRESIAFAVVDKGALERPLSVSVLGRCRRARMIEPL